jgi:iron complex transport system substrate-binding protein
MAAGHWVPELARLAGGGDPLGQAGEPSRDAGPDEIVAAAPDVVVLMPCGFDLARTLAVSAEVTRRPGFGRLPAARTGGVVAVDGPSSLNRPGPSILDGLDLMAAIVRAKPGDPLPAGAAWVPLARSSSPGAGAMGTDDLPGSRPRTGPHRG